jgi:hypothetical protein
MALSWPAFRRESRPRTHHVGAAARPCLLDVMDIDRCFQVALREYDSRTARAFVAALTVVGSLRGTRGGASHSRARSAL